MFYSWVIITAALAYMGFLFAVAYYGDRISRKESQNRNRPVIYALSLGIYCTSWTFFGSVGLSATSGLDFIPVYLGAIIMIGIGWPIINRIATLSKRHNITSIADFMAARYGKNQSLAAIVTIIAVAGIIPYIALQLKAVSDSFTTLLEPVGLVATAQSGLPFGDAALFIAISMAVFSVLFGTRHIDATENQEGLMLAIATESIVKILAFVIVGIFVTFSMFGGLGPLIEQASESDQIRNLFSRGLNGGNWLTVTYLSLVCIILLPRQFHVAVVENNTTSEIKTAAWLFPLYLIIINLFVVPIAIAGLLTFENGLVSSDMFVLALPMSADASFITFIAFVGGLSAATAMVIVATIALSIMVCNEIAVPLMLRRSSSVLDREDMGVVLLNIRRSAIFAILILGYLFYRLIGEGYPLASIGLLSFAAIAQFAPAFFIGLVWRRATAKGAIAGIVAGFAVWSYTLLLPSFASSGLVSPEFLTNGPFGISLLRPEVLFNLEFAPLTHGVFWSLIVNVTAYVTVSMSGQQEPIERLQANAFIVEDFPRPPAPTFRLSRTSVSVGELIKTAARYLGEERTHRSFNDYATSHNIVLNNEADADVQILRFTEHLLASAIGAASSRLVLSLLLRRRNVGHKSALKLLDDASEALQYNRDLLQSALDQVGQGIAIFDADMRLICWNRQFRGLLNLPTKLGRVGIPLDQIVEFIVDTNSHSNQDSNALLADRIHNHVVSGETYQERLDNGKKVVEIQTEKMPQGGIVVTYTNITERVEAAEVLARVNESLESRVHERTAELTEVNQQLALAKIKADEANLDKTRFLAAASHDILQPLNAARLYTTSLVERDNLKDGRRLIQNVDASLEAVEEILNALLDISRLDAGAMRPELSSFLLGDIFDQLKLEFSPVAAEKNLQLVVVGSSLAVHSDRRLLRRVLQNLISNAIKYTDHGKIVVGCRKQGDHISIEVHDSGPGIPEPEQDIIFREFQRLTPSKTDARGLGLGLSIVERIGRVLNHKISVTSILNRGSAFKVKLPAADMNEATVDPKTLTLPRVGHIAGSTILCIDNEEAILDGMEQLLSTWQCAVIKSTNGVEAISQIQESGMVPEILIVDYHLDEQTGLDAINLVRQHLQSDLPAIVVTADRSVEVTEEVRSAGHHLLRKPLRPAQLRALMAQFKISRVAAE